MSDDDIMMLLKKQPSPIKLKRPKKAVIPKREPSVLVPSRYIVYKTADKTTCAECTCFPKEEAYQTHKKLLPCLMSPRTLYELAADAVDQLQYPAALAWTVDDVANWMERDVGLQQYRACIVDNHIDGMRLLMLEDPSNLPSINIHYFKHIQMITSQIRKVYSMDFIQFLRSIGLPPRRPLVHTTWFKSRTGPSWGIRQKWSRCVILRWMKLIMPEPVHLDHWDLVWYQKSDFPSVKFARVPPIERAGSEILRKKAREKPKQNMVPRKFIIITDVPPEEQFIWLEPTSYSPFTLSEDEHSKGKKEIKFLIKEDSRLLPKKIHPEGLKGRDLILARRKMPKPKFLEMK